MNVVNKSYGTIFHTIARTACLAMQDLGCGPVDSNGSAECTADSKQDGEKLHVGSRHTALTSDGHEPIQLIHSVSVRKTRG
jgi:hypothetical protein